MNLPRINLRFSECEHLGDVDTYKEDVINSGGVIRSESLDVDAEECTIVIDTVNPNSFMAKFRHTDSYGFATIFPFR